MPGPKYAVGERVEVLALDFETPSTRRSRFEGSPEVWMPATVTAVDSMQSGDRWAVEVTPDGGRPPIRYAVGEYGIKYIRAF